MFYKYTVYLWEEEGDEEATHCNGLVCGDSYFDATDRLSRAYGEDNIESINISIIGSDNTLEFPDEYNDSINAIADYQIW